MNICFLMYNWEEMVPENDTSLSLIHECVKRGHGAAMCTPANLTIRNSVTNAFCTVIGRMEKVPSTLKAFYNKAELREEMLPLAGFDAIFCRANPPLEHIKLNFLDSVKEDVFIVNSLEEAINIVKNDDQAFIIGGGEIYKQAMSLANKIEITRVHENFEADTFFPKIDTNIWKEISITYHDKDDQHDHTFSFITYIKK